MRATGGSTALASYESNELFGSSASKTTFEVVDSGFSIHDGRQVTAREGARLHPVARDHQPARSLSRNRFRAPGPHPARRHTGEAAAAARDALRTRRRPALLRPLAQGRRHRAHAHLGLTWSTSTAGGTRRSKTKPRTARSASARSATCWFIGSFVVARSKRRSMR